MGPLFFIKEGLVINNKLLTMGIYLFFSLEHRSRHVITQSSAHVRRHVSAAALRDVYTLQVSFIPHSCIHLLLSSIHSCPTPSFGSEGACLFFFFSEKCVSLLWQHLFGRISPAKILKPEAFGLFSPVCICAPACVRMY